MSSGRCPGPAFGRMAVCCELVYVSAFVEAALAAKCFGSAATATGDSAIAARCATNKAPKDDSITGAVSGSIADAEPMLA